MRWWYSLLVATVISLLLPFSIRAQSTLELDKAQISIWPEYDKPGVLVIYHLLLSAKVSLPADVSVRIPQVVGKPNAVAMQDVDGSLVTLSYTTTTEGDWTRINFTAPSPDIQIEYYDPRLTKEGTKRTYEYRWPGDYTVNALSVQVQQPVGATNMEILPNLGAGHQQQDGLTYYDTDVGQLKAGTGFTIRLSYDKSTDTLSAPSQPVSPSGQIDQNTPGRLSFQEVLPWVLGAVGLLLVTGGGLWYWQSGRERRPVMAKRRHTAAARKETDAEAESNGGEAIYCHQCGRRANQGDVFCRTCGTRLRA